MNFGDLLGLIAGRISLLRKALGISPFIMRDVILIYLGKGLIRTARVS
jgi:hypothetical protein